MNGLVELIIAIAVVAVGLLALGIIWSRRKMKRDARLGRRVKRKIDLFREDEAGDARQLPRDTGRRRDKQD